MRHLQGLNCSEQSWVWQSAHQASSTGRGSLGPKRAHAAVPAPTLPHPARDGSATGPTAGPGQPVSPPSEAPGQQGTELGGRPTAPPPTPTGPEPSHRLRRASLPPAGMLRHHRQRCRPPSTDLSRGCRTHLGSAVPRAAETRLRPSGRPLPIPARSRARACQKKPGGRGGRREGRPQHGDRREGARGGQAGGQTENVMEAPEQQRKKSMKRGEREVGRATVPGEAPARGS